MRGYESVSWQADELPKQITAISAHIEQLDQPALARQVSEIASRPGTLHTCLALSSTHQTRVVRGRRSGTRAQVLGKVISLAHTSFPEKSVAELITWLSPLFRWDYGVTAIDYGVSALGDEGTTKLMVAVPNSLLEAIHTIWLIGLMRIAGFKDHCCEALEVLRSSRHLSEGSISPLEIVGKITDSCFSKLEKDLLGSYVRGWPNSTARLKLWRNALMMAKHHRDEESEGQLTFYELLRHVRRGGTCPFPCEENNNFKEISQETYEDCKKFWLKGFLRETSCVYGNLTVSFLDDPLDILNIGNAFDTCLRFGGWSELQLLGWATNVNVRVVVARATDAKMLGRRTIGLSLRDVPGVTQYRTYPSGNRVMKKTISEFVNAFVQETGLEWCDGGKIKNTCTPAYEDDFLEYSNN